MQKQCMVILFVNTPTLFNRGAYCSEIAERAQICAKNSLFEIFQEMKSLYCRGLYTFFVQYTTPKGQEKSH